MFTCINDEKIFQTLPGQGWRVLIQWNPIEADAAEGFPATTLEPVIAWVTVKVQRKTKGRLPYEDVIIAPLVRWPSGDELFILDSSETHTPRFVYLAPNEELSNTHFVQLAGGYALPVTPEHIKVVCVG